MWGRLTLFILSILFFNAAVAGEYGKVFCHKQFNNIGICLKSLEACSKKCHEGSPDACRFLGCIYKWGDGIKQNYKAAFKYIKIACDHGSGPSCNTLGSFYEDGIGTKRNPLKAHEYTVKSCELKYGGACQTIGSRYLHGSFGYSKNLKQALYYLTEACNYDKKYCGYLASMYEQGIGVHKDLKRAFLLRERACSAGGGWVAEDCCIAGKYHASGVTGKKDLLAAEKLFTQSCKEGYSESCFMLCNLDLNIRLFSNEKILSLLTHCSLDVKLGKKTGVDDYGCRTLLCLERKNMLRVKKKEAEDLLCRAGYGDICKKVQDRVLNK